MIFKGEFKNKYLNFKLVFNLLNISYSTTSLQNIFIDFQISQFVCLLNQIHLQKNIFIFYIINILVPSKFIYFLI